MLSENYISGAASKVGPAARRVDGSGRVGAIRENVQTKAD